MTEGLFIGGSAHGKWIATEKNQCVVRIPKPVVPCLWENSDECSMCSTEEQIYTLRDIRILNKLGVIFVLNDLDAWSMQTYVLDTLLSENGKRVVGV